MPNINILTCIPYAEDWNLGQAYNEVMGSLPEDGWACLLDHDAMFTTGVWYRQLVDAIKREPQGTFTGITNRIGQLRDEEGWQQIGGLDRDCHDIALHRKIGTEMVELPHLLDVTDDRLMAGVMILMSKESWKAMGYFKEGLRGVDYAAHIALKKAGRKVFCIQGLYIYHWKRGDGTQFPKGTPLYNWRQDLEPGDPRRNIRTVSAC